MLAKLVGMLLEKAYTRWQTTDLVCLRCSAHSVGPGLLPVHLITYSGFLNNHPPLGGHPGDGLVLSELARGGLEFWSTAWRGVGGWDGSVRTGAPGGWEGKRRNKHGVGKFSAPR